MNTKYTIWLLSGALLASVIVNVVLAKANLSYFDEAYGNLAQQNLVNSRVRKHLERSEIEAAKEVLDREIESKGSVLSICLMENCSSSAREILHEEQ